jgi:hypothetical protein
MKDKEEFVLWVLNSLEEGRLYVKVTSGLEACGSSIVCESQPCMAGKLRPICALWL